MEYKKQKFIDETNELENKVLTNKEQRINYSGNIHPDCLDLILRKLILLEEEIKTLKSMNCPIDLE